MKYNNLSGHFVEFMKVFRQTFHNVMKTLVDMSSCLYDVRIV